MNPLIADVSKLKDAEVESKILELSKKFFQTQNPGLQAQIQSLLSFYTQELQARRIAAWENQYTKRDKRLDDLVKVR